MRGFSPIEANWRRRQQIWMEYRDGLKCLPLVLPRLPDPHTRHSYHLFPIQVPEAEAGLTRD